MSFVYLGNMYSGSREPSPKVAPKPASYWTPDMVSKDAKKGNKETVVDYSEHATTHGIYYIFEREGSVFSKIFW